jgi:hypothetical protein
MALHNIETPQDIRDFIVNTLKEVKQIDETLSCYNQSKWSSLIGLDEKHPCGTNCCIMGWRLNFDSEKLEIQNKFFSLHHAISKDTDWISGKFRSQLVVILEQETIEAMFETYDQFFHGIEELKEKLKELGLKWE